MMVVIADAIFETSWRTGGLNAPKQAPGNQHAQRVVHGLERNGADLRPDNVGHAVGRNVRLCGDRPKDRQSLGRDLYAAITKEVCPVDIHGTRLDPFLE
jgi:hypothetical protein